MINHERYDVFSLPSKIDEVPKEKIAPMKIRENRANATNTKDFLVTSWDDIHTSYEILILKM